ncbi:hypothetical protein J7E73_31710 [Paenibacillus albidus]|uniref:hypothetical protein n=1 Tax=Paenibacillus albidus TaxID=2041023 RepID=UPI001BECF9A4|nr:hypothetical protein [Paenibacillus albidus]MBT2293580.1 hypothetical protein [Paenibacillus albidus]
MNDNLWKSFIDCFKSPGVTRNFIDYYTAITSWIQNNKHHFSVDLLEKNRLDILINLNPNIYVIEDPGFPLAMELKRFEKNIPEKLEIFAMILGNRLWEMVTIRGEECPNCEGDEMRYLLAEEISTKDKKIILECNSCGWTENIDGTLWSGGRVAILPANKEDLKSLFIS